MNPHSYRALNLRYMYRELRDARERSMAYGMALAALHGNPSADIGKGGEMVNSRFTLADSFIPYYNSTDSETVRKEARERAVNVLRAIKRNLARPVSEDV